MIAAGKPGSTPVVIVENASLPEASKRFGRLKELPQLAAGMSGGPVLILLGEVLRAAQEAGSDELVPRSVSHAA